MSSGAYVLEERTIGALPPTTNATSRWVMNEGSGTLVEDSIGSNDGTITGATWLGSGNFGYQGDNAVNFDGTGDYIEMADATELEGMTTGTFEWWERPSYTGTPTVNYSSFFSKGSSHPTLTTYGAYHYTDGNIYLHLNGAGGISMGLYQPIANKWYHHVITFDGTNARRYLNGNLVTTTATVNGSGSSTFPFYIGAYVYNSGTGTASNNHRGAMECFSIYKDSVMTAATVLSNYRAGFQYLNNMRVDGQEQLLEEVEVPASSSTQNIDFLYPLDGETDGGYRVELMMIAGSSNTSTYGSLMVNNGDLYTDADASRSYILQSGASSVSGAYAATVGAIGAMVYTRGTAGTNVSGQCDLTIFPTVTNKKRIISFKSTTGNNTTNLLHYFEFIGTMVTPADTVIIQSLGVAGTVASTFGAGTIVRLYKLNLLT